MKIEFFITDKFSDGLRRAKIKVIEDKGEGGQSASTEFSARFEHADLIFSDPDRPSSEMDQFARKLFVNMLSSVLDLEVGRALAAGGESS
jgi:hypothetical protein